MARGFGVKAAARDPGPDVILLERADRILAADGGRDCKRGVRWPAPELDPRVVGVTSMGQGLDGVGGPRAMENAKAKALSRAIGNVCRASDRNSSGRITGAESCSERLGIAATGRSADPDAGAPRKGRTRSLGEHTPFRGRKKGEKDRERSLD